MHFTAFDAYAELPGELPVNSARQSHLPELISIACLALLWGVAAINTLCAALIALGLA